MSLESTPAVSHPPRSQAHALFLLGSLTLFLELVLIRYLAGSIWNLGYFPNLVLVGAFVGMGLGFVCHHQVSSHTSPRLFHLAAFLLAVLAVLVALLRPAVPGLGGSQADFGGELYFTRSRETRRILDPLLLAVWLLMVVAVFALIAQRTAKLFRGFRPLRAYTLDIAGSCAGILAFMAMSWFQAPAWAWFLVVAFLFAAASERRRTVSTAVAGLAVVGVALLAAYQDRQLMARETFDGAILTRWSPYQKVQYVDTEDLPHQIFVNGIAHQHMVDDARLRARATGVPYLVPYDLRRSDPGLPPYRNVLVLGAGSGNDVAAALVAGATHVDAVEIDPVIADLGRHFHPARPYADPRVNLVVADGRQFLTRASGRYDLIVFALTDSLVKVSPMAQLRLENYLFTEECVRRAHELLSDDGDLLFYNFYRQPWIRAKIESMVQQATGYFPREVLARRDFVMMAAGRHSRENSPSEPIGGVDPARDDWPFPYLRRHGIPRAYRGVMAALVIALLALMLWLQRSSRHFPHLSSPRAGLAIKLAFAFMGIAFLLLETKSVVNFSLLFGTTWLNNSLVFLGVLVLVLAANALAARLPRVSPGLVFAPLVVSCLLTLVYPLGRLLAVEDPLPRFVAATLLTFSPIFFANVLFGIAFRDQAVPEHVFGWNLIGATFGAVLEYASLIFGYNALAVLVVVCYTAAFLAIVSASRTMASGGAPERP
jgi:spermidine synthase